MSISVGYAGTSILQGIQPESIECAQLADMGETATGAFTVEDDAAALTLIGYQPVTISESACSQPRLFTGWTFERGYQRDPENAILTGVARTHDVSIVDMNACFGFRQITRTGAGGGNRPAETWLQRLTWILGSEYLSPYISSSQAFVIANTTAMDAADYRGSYPSAVLQDLSDRSGNAYDYFAFWDPLAKEVRLFFNNDAASIGDSVLRISNVKSDEDGLTTFGPDKLAKLQRESDQVYSDVCVNYADGTLKLYRSRPSTYNTFVRRSTQIDRPYTRGVATATLQAEAFLTKHSVETDRVTCTIRVPASRVGLVQAGQRIQFKAPHMPGYAAFTWMRVVMCTPKPANEAATHYDVELELVYRTTTAGIPFTCAVSIGTVETAVALETGTYSPEVTITPTQPGPLLIFAWLIGNDGNVPAATNMTEPMAGYTTAWNEPTSSRSTFTLGYRQEAVVSGGYTAAATYTPGFDFAGGGWLAVQMAIATEETAPVQVAYDDPADVATLPGDPTAGNIILMFCKAENGAGDITPVGAGWVELLRESRNTPPINVELAIYARCVNEGDGRRYEFASGGGYDTSTACGLQEWAISGSTDPGVDDEDIVLPPAPGSTTTHTTNPTVTDDADAGYAVGAIWVNETTGEVFICVDNTPGAAVWVSMTGGGAGEGSVYTAITPARIQDSRYTDGGPIGLAGVFTSATPRMLQVTGVGGVPAGATAVTGNLTVTNQTHAGFLSLTTTSIADPTTSTLNFPAGDNRANGVTASLGAGGVMWIVYLGTDGAATTDVIFDVTGYFEPSGETVGGGTSMVIVGEGVTTTTVGGVTTVTLPSWAPTTAGYLVTTDVLGLSDNKVVVGLTPGGDLGGTWPSPTVDAGTGGGGQIMISDTPSTPLIFADLIQNEAEDDLVYADA